MIMTVIMHKIIIFLLILTLNLLPSQSSRASNIFSDSNNQLIISDPMIKINRKLYKFNTHLDKYTIKPAAKIYRNYTSYWFKIAVNNFINNTNQPFNIINCLLQGKIKKASVNLSSFVINSSIGFLGIFDPAHNNIKLPKYDKEDFGQTLAVYNFPAGPYLVLPIFGPTSLRDLTGKSVNFIYDPVWDGVANDNKAELLTNSLQGVTVRDKLLEYIDDIEQNSFDPYSVVKSSYYQNRIRLIEK